MNIKDEILANPILRNVQVKFENQTTKGLAKYGETVNPKSYDTIGWLKHLQQELIDGVVYIEVLIQKVEELQDALKGAAIISNQAKSYIEENERLREALEFYADKKQYKERIFDEILIFYDYGKKARQALKEVNNI